MITSFGPEGEENIYLKHIAEKDVKMDENIWKYDELGNIGQKLTELSTCLLEQTDWKVRDFTKNVIDELHTIWIHLGESCLLEVSKGVNDETCHSCMINKKAKQTSMNQRHIENCKQKIEVCIACEKNSFLNPITCYCGLELTPSIGNRWGALLIAGTDADDD
ncbi:uncharacterized protein LOC132716476 [Ruditapes philippinarum]|uniref:uncharacterized protein LOC132716476 n=1 Tax=Ruditapes philippinarum TaxID=129788 RepID=UPI00295BE682|nr:uncharacterized protein LOC132716476 [Ruditapes philippinarum]